MKKVNSLGNRLIALMLSIIMVLGMLPANIIAQELTAEAQIGDVTYDTLADAIAAVPTGADQAAPAEVTTIKLLKNTAYAFDVGTSNGSTTMNLKLDLNGNTLTLSPSVGSVGTKSNGIRVLAYSKLEIANGTLVCFGAEEDNVKVGIANYGTLTLTDVAVKSGDLTIYTVNNRGALTLNGKTTIESGSTCAITNDPYNLYYTTDVNASVTCNSSDVVVDSILVERYERTSDNNGGVELNISAGYFGKIVEDGNSAISVSYNVTGGTIGVSTTAELELALSMAKAGAEYACPQTPVTIKLLGDVAGSFDVGTSNGKAPKNILLDLNGKTLTLAPSVGSVGTKSNGIRVLAYSKLEIKNGTIVCSSEESDNVKVGIANYSDLTLEDVKMKSGDLTIFTINNRGSLTLAGTTSVENGKVAQSDYADSTDYIAITNDPYNLYYSEPINAEINCDSATVKVGNIQLEAYGSQGDIELNITNGSFGGVYQPAAEGTVTVKGAISGGSFGTDVSDYCIEKYAAVLVDGKYYAQYVKDDQVDFAFADKEPVISFNDNAENKYSYMVQNAKGTVTYFIVSEKNVSGEDDNIAEINAETGELTVIKPGVVTVKASDTGNDLYNPAEATYTLTINKDNQEIAFATPIPEDQWVGASFINTASGGDGTGEISYWLVDGENLVEEIPNVAKINKTTGEVTFLCVGTQITVKAVKAADDYYNEASASYTVTATRKEPTEVAFATTGPITITYNPENLSFKNSVVGCGDDDVITWSVTSGSDVADLDTTTGTLTIKKAGTIVVKATVAESPYYYEKTIEYTLTINPANQADLNTDSIPTQITYSPDVQEGLIVGAGGSGTGAYGYEIVEGNEFAEINAQTGAIKILKAGNFVGDEFVNGVIKVKITKAGDECYNAAEPVYVTITLTRAAQSGFGFGKTEKVGVTYNDDNNEYTLLATGGQSKKDVVYKVINGDAATVNESTGVVTILKSGVVTIQATKPADDQYEKITDTYELTIEKDEQSFTFNHAKQINEKYGLTSFETKITPSALNSGKVTYAVSGDAIGASVNDEGLVTFANSTGKVGTITVTVTMAEDDCYKLYTDTYTITLSYEEVPEVPYTLHGDKIINDSKWFTSDVRIYAPENYQISYSNDLTGNEWDDYVEWEDDGENGKWAEGFEPVVYLKKVEEGQPDKITNAISVSDLKRDTEKPNGLAISYEPEVWVTIAESLLGSEIVEKWFGFAASTVRVTVSAADSLSGIGKMEYSLDGGNTYTEITASNGKYEFDVESQYDGQLWIRATDVAGNYEFYKHLKDDKDAVLIVDHTGPGLTVGYTGGMDDVATEGIRYVKSKDGVKVVFEITDENFDLREADPTVVVIRNNEETPVVLMNGDDEAKWIFDDTSGKLTFDLVEEGDYVIKAEFTDRLNRKTAYESEVRVDRTKPVIESTIENGKYYTENQTFVLTITEHNFDATKVNLVVNAVDSKNDAVLNADEIQKFADDARVLSNWDHTEGTDVYTLDLPITKDGNYTVTVDCTDTLEWVADTHSRTFTLDKVDPNVPTLTYEVGTAKSGLIIEEILNALGLTELFGFAKETTVVTVQSGDATSGIDRLEYKIHNDDDKYTVVSMDADGKYSFNLDPQYRGKITVVVYDKAGHSATTVEEKEIVVDDIAPDVEIEFTGDRQDAVKADNDNIITRETMTSFNDSTRFIYNGNVTATIKVKEANFFPDNEDMAIKITCDGTALTDFAASGITDSGWQLSEGVYTRTFVMTKDGDYKLFAEYKDHSLNDMEWDSNEYAQSGVYSYESNIHTIDTTAPVYEVTYNNNAVIQTLDGREYYDASRVATIKVTDRNFRPSEVVFSVDYTDVAGEKVAYTYSELTSWSDWTPDGDTWTATVTFEPDANYTVSFSYDDLANHNMVGEDVENGSYNKLFTVDTTKPVALGVAYNSKDDQVLNKILNAITFGNYQADQEVVLTMTDATAGIDYIKLTVTPEGPASATNRTMPVDLEVNADGTVKSGTKGFIDAIKSVSKNGDLTLSFDVPAQFRGKISFVAYDKSSNHSDSHTDPGVLVVDTFAPGHTISYNPSNVVNVSDMKDMTDFVAATGITDITSTDASYVMYFSGDAVATIKIDEANFDPSVVMIEVFDGNGVAVQGWTQTDWTTVTEAGKADSHTKTVTIPTEGDYQLKVYYQDHSMNTPVDYLSQWIVIDKTAPEISVEYSNTDVKNTIENRDYFATTQTATITIKEHNFRADDVEIQVKATDVLGKDVLLVLDEETHLVKAYAEQGVERSEWSPYEVGSWRREDDTYVITLIYDADANYTFDIDYKDLALNVAEDYTPDKFTVDTTAPTVFAIEYSTNVFNEVLSNITFGYYNAKMTVTITAKDMTSGIYYFTYSYINGKNVSKVNAELLDQAIREAEITYLEENGKLTGEATYTFEIPKMVLGDDNQFNGTVTFSAHDCSENLTEKKDNHRIVVDNIAPTATITYNAPVQNANGISYYDGDINATIEINEANFDAERVIVTVTKDGKSYPVNVSWTDNSVDIHTGTFTLTEDGDYIVSVEYTDKSTNAMESYQSNQLTLDTVKPVIEVSDIRNNSANKDEVYGFTISTTDTNLAADTFEVTLTAVITNDNGVYTVETISLGDLQTVEAGKSYYYQIENLEADGLYTLTAEIKDMSGNTTSVILLDDDNAYDAVAFSINRDGSAFRVDDNTDKLVNQYYVYSVNNDVVIEEVNVDPIENYTVKLNGTVLSEGTDYTTTQTSNEGEWSKRTYVINKALFAAEGEYSVVVESVDKAETAAYSDVKNLNVSFVVDQTAPVLTITGLDNNSQYQVEEQVVTVIPTDDGGRLYSFTAIVLNGNGEPKVNEETGEDISVRFSMEGEELQEYLEANNGRITFTIPEGYQSKVQIVCTDCAENTDGETNTYEVLYEKVTVTQNEWLIFYAKKPLFYGTVGGILLLIALIVLLIVRKKKKKNAQSK